MQIENNYNKEVYNGDIGFVADIELEEGELTVSFDGRRSVVYGFGELDTLVSVREQPQEPRLGIPSRGDSRHDAAVRHYVRS
jgi:ATP-dependent exoDNAse (exonuclease V) alpha subunit